MRKRQSTDINKEIGYAVVIIPLAIVLAIFFGWFGDSNDKTTKTKPPGFLKIKGLETKNLFRDMNTDILYYGQVVRNPKDYAPLVGDARIYDRHTAQMMYQYHCYRFFKYHTPMDDMKGDFLKSFLVEHHGLTQSEVGTFFKVVDRHLKQQGL